MKRTKRERQALLRQTIEDKPFITDEALAKKFDVSIQTIRLDRMELKIPELRERIRTVAASNWKETVKALPIDEVIGEVIDLELDQRAISILDITEEHVFSRNNIARGHHLFAQANSLAVAVINEPLALTANADIKFTRQVVAGERVIAKAKVKPSDSNKRTIVEINSYVDNETVFTGSFEMFRSNHRSEGSQHENSD